MSSAVSKSAIEDVKERLLLINELLEKRFGTPQREALPPLDELIRTILSQNTSDKNSHRAFANLKRAFPDWHSLLSAPPSQIEEAIRIGGLSQIKAKRIKEIVKRLKEMDPSLTLSFLSDYTPEEIKQFLLSLPGVGAKTAACVLLFSLKKPAFPVDTHILRISKRLCLAQGKTSADNLQTFYEAHLPPHLYLPLHLNLIRLGREICHPRKPLCHICPLEGICPKGACDSDSR